MNRTILILVVCMLLFGGSYSSSSMASPPQFADDPTWPDASYYDEDGPPISLTCHVKHDPSVFVSWYRDGERVHSEAGVVEITNQNQSLTFPDPKPSQTGTYRCLAINSLGNVSHSGYIYIADRTEETRPRVVETDPTTLVSYASPGDDVNISCVFDVGGTYTALMDLELTWNKDNVSLNDTYHHTWDIDTTDTHNQIFSLTINNVQVSDYGLYECFGKNLVGNDSRVIEISRPLPASGLRNKWIYIGGGIAGFVLMVVVIVSATIIHRRHVLKQKYENLEWAEPDMEQLEVPDYTIQYDVFISYSSDDQAWVKDILFDKLSQNKFEVCIDFKDFTPGMAVSDNIMDSIYKSRKTIVVMSSNFLKSMWGQFELQQAHIRAVVQREDVLILIKYDNCKVPPKLMGNTFLDWTDAGVQPHFWQRLYESIGEPIQNRVQNEADIENETNIQSEADIQNEANIQIEADIENEADIDNEVNIQNEDNEVNIQNEADIQNEAYIENEALTENRMDNQTEKCTPNGNVSNEKDDNIPMENRLSESNDIRELQCNQTEDLEDQLIIV